MSGRRKAASGELMASRRRTLAGIAAAAPAAALASPAHARGSGLPAMERALWELEAELDVLLAGLDRLEEEVAESLALVSCPQDVAVTVGYSVCASEREVRQAAKRWGVAVAECQRALEELRVQQAKLTAFRERHGLAGLDRRAFDLTARAAALKDQLATTPADTAADVAVKVRRLLASALAGGDGREAALARTALEALERLGDPA